MKNIVPTAIPLLLLLYGCGAIPEVISHEPGIYTLKHTNGRMLIPGNVTAAMQRHADKICNKSWRKLNERHLNQGEWGTEEWDIKCL